MERKKICQFGKRLYLCTRFRRKNGVVEKAGGSDSTLKRMKQEIACVGSLARVRLRTRTSQRWKRNSYNEEFDPGSG